MSAPDLTDARAELRRWYAATGRAHASLLRWYRGVGYARHGGVSVDRDGYHRRLI